MGRNFWNVVISGTKDNKTNEIKYNKLTFYNSALDRKISSPDFEDQSKILSPFHEISLERCNEFGRFGYLVVKNIQTNETISKKLVYDYDHVLHLETIEVPISKDINLVIKANQFYCDPNNREDIDKIFECGHIKASKIYSTLCNYDEKEI